jgi:flagellar hook-associated protein 2
MAFSSLGVGSGLDLSGLLTQLTTSERQPLLALDARGAAITTKLSAYGQLQSGVSSLQTASAKLADLSLFQGVKADSSFNTVLTASAKNTAAAGKYAINVSQLAQAQTLATAGQASATAAVGSGTVTIDFGTFTPAVTDPASPASFEKNAARTSATIVVGAESNTLEGIRDAINAQKDSGVTASIVNDGSGTPFRLLLASTDTGAASGLKISVDGDAALSNLLAYDPTGSSTLTETAAAKNAQLTVNGLSISSATNTVEESLQGVTLNLVKTGDSTVTVAADTGSAKSAVSAFVAAYNNLLGVGKSLTNFDPDTKKGSALTGDSTLRNLQVQLRTALTSPQSGATGDLTVLSDVGVSFQKDGTLAVDSAKLDTAISGNLAGVAKLFAGTATDTSGFGKQIAKLALDFTSPGGTLTTASDGLTGSLKRLDSQYQDASTRIDATLARYKKQFTQLDVTISRLNATGSYLTAQFDAINASAGK